VTPDAVRVRKKELSVNRRDRRQDAIEEAQAVE
jgi:GTP-binding protein